ncbi:glycosyltransferase family 4 protein [Sunxiuqinia elliptica]|uniref:Glycosyltransferase involved in cell wall biosynthesis n=1 Tax=Sunxiuqinia elliptica TaxID=655355 RepID=A0A4R6H6R4_9BACT|nr:glycosyltransferase family 4 protein [Sunxiuqinia elliptica]TDO03890.1 glycosyltransferase involved in cell wall biosynthesis [Sunxiuqinia elliptica]TDO62172.1 glycosyltransferase involved in cell wall biosynthesis [Sunxiuqinia elliptica]
MKVLMLLGEEFPPDNRVEKEARSLIDNGFEVTIVCQTTNERPAYEYYQGIHVYRLKLSGLQYKLSAACLVVPSYFWLWKSFLRKLLKQKDYDIVHVHDLPLSIVGYYIKKKYRLKLVCDQHEFYSNWIVHTAHYNTRIGKIVKWLSPWENYERKYLNKADLVVTVENPLRSVYVEKVGIAPEKIICLPNMPSIKIFNSSNIDSSVQKRFRSHFVLLYAGGMDILRGIDVAIRAIPYLKEEIPDILLLLVGNIRKPFAPVEMAEKLGVGEYVHLEGWSPVERLPSYIAASDLCFFTPPSNRDEINKTIATKIYQYMQLDKPVIVGRAKMMKDFVEEHQIGYSVNETNPKEFAQQVIYYHRTREEKARIGKNCRAIKDQYVWERGIENLLERYKNL